MPRTKQQIIDHADELAEQLAAGDFTVTSGPHDAGSLRQLAHAVVDAGHAQAAVTDAVARARADGHPWAAISLMLGTSTQSAQRQYHHVDTP